MRIDKFLKNSRIIKRRTLAKKACDGGRVEINGRTAKPGDEVDLGDRVQVDFGRGPLRIEVVSVDEPTRKYEAEDMYRLIGEDE